MQRRILIGWLGCLMLMPAWGEDRPFGIQDSTLSALEQSARWPRLKEGEFHFTPAEIDQLLASPALPALTLTSLESTLRTSDRESLVFQSASPYASGARTWEIRDQDRRPVARTSRSFFVASTMSTRAVLIIDRQAMTVDGLFARDGLSLEVRGDLRGTLEMRQVANALDDPSFVNQCSTSVDQQPVELVDLLSSASPAHRAAGSVLGDPTFQTVVAVDTDNEWMSNSFGNNTTNAMAFIEDLFMFMNVFYERDLSTRILLGDTFLRTTADPYTPGGDSLDRLVEFTDFWRLNQDAIDRDFAMLLSGRSVSPGQFSGVAWLDLYCQNGFIANVNGVPTPVGSYSYNGIGSSRTAANTAQFVGHELGHNLGSVHTHCYNPPVDMCFNAEPGCFAASVSCPVPQGDGTIMSYCHFSVGNGGANCGTNREEFHPTVSSFLNGRIMANFPACISSFQAGNEPPVAMNDNYVMDEDTTLVDAAPGVLANDSDPEMAALTAVLDSGLSGLSFNPDGSFTYTPAANFSGAVNFTYHANDGEMDSPMATVNILVRDVSEDAVFLDGYEGDGPP